MKNTKAITISEENFKNIKRGKQKSLITLNNDIIKDIKKHQKIFLINEKNNKKIKLKIKKISKYFGLEELSNNINLKDFGYKKQEKIDYRDIIYSYDKELIEQNGILDIKFKIKKHIPRKIFLILLIMFILVFVYRSIINFKDKYVSKNVQKIINEEVVNVIVDINPSIFFKVKNGTIIETACLNEDCTNLLTKLNYDKNKYLYNDTNGKPLNETIQMIYNESKKQGYDTSDGINISSSSSSVGIIVKDIKDSTFKQITFKEELDKIGAVVDTKEVELTKEEYNQKLLDELKKDSDYGKAYNCSISDGEVKCYLTNFADKIVDEFGKRDDVEFIKELIRFATTFTRVLDKFKFEYKKEELAISEVRLADYNYYEYATEMVIGIGDCNNKEVDRVRVIHGIRLSEDDSTDYTQYQLLSLYDVELLSHTYNQKDVIYIDSGKYMKDCNS